MQRWLKFCKYLPEFGWEPIVYTAQDAEYPSIDEALEKQVSSELTVLRQPILEPYGFYKKLTGKKKDEKIKQEFVSREKEGGAFKENLAVWIRGNFFIPDARKFWIKPSINYLKAFLKENPVDAIVSNGTPHSVHLIALALKQEFGLPWLADFRDPWTKVDYFEDLKLSARSRAKHEKFEREVLSQSDAQLTVSPTWAAEFKGLGGKNAHWITNGFDPIDFSEQKPVLDQKLTISHVGNLSGDRFHEPFWKAIAELIHGNERLKQVVQFQLVGEVDGKFIRAFRDLNIEAQVDLLGQVSHQEALRITRASQGLLLMLGNKQKSQGRIPAKVFEYLAAERPILSLGPEGGDVAQIIAEAGAGTTVDFDATETLKSTLMQWFEAFGADGLKVQTKGVSKFTRKALTEQLAGVLNSI